MSSDFSSQYVCCCEVTSWAKWIAWIQIIFYAGTTATFLNIFSIFGSGEEEVQKTLESNDYLTSYENVPHGTLLWLSILLFILSIVSFIMAFVLLHGVTERKPGCLKSWIYYTSACLIFQILWILKMIDGVNVIAGLLLIVVSVTIGSFCMSLVQTLRTDMEAAEEAANKGDEEEPPKEDEEVKEKKDPDVKAERPKVFCLCKIEQPTEEPTE